MDEGLRKFVVSMRNAKRLLTDDIANYFEADLYKKAIPMQCLEPELHDMQHCCLR
jgi:hypothetical protein